MQRRNATSNAPALPLQWASPASFHFHFQRLPLGLHTASRPLAKYVQMCAAGAPLQRSEIGRQPRAKSWGRTLFKEHDPVVDAACDAIA